MRLHTQGYVRQPSTDNDSVTVGRTGKMPNISWLTILRQLSTLAVFFLRVSSKSISIVVRRQGFDPIGLQ